MKKIVIKKPGGYDSLELVDVDDLTCSANTILVEVKYFGVNMADVFVRIGLYDKAKEFGYPIVPGFEFSGVVKEVGSDVANFSIGDRVLGVTLFGGYATQILVNSQQIVKVPDCVDLDIACTLPVNYLTAKKILKLNSSFKKVLVHSALGGVGLALVNLCLQANKIVCGVVSTENKKQVLLESFNNKSLRVCLKKDYFNLFDKFDLIAHSYGGNFLRQDKTLLSTNGSLVVFGFSTFLRLNKQGKLPFGYYIYAIYNYMKMPKIDVFNDLVSQNISVHGLNLAFSFYEDLPSFKEEINQVLDLYVNNKLVLPKVSRFSMQEIGKAQKFLEDAANFGKVIIEV